ncbi:hypothetical protein SDC9_114643 [bioreactor metagenome]|uniref:Uncharacterized protein n=1 Tax=bioreactor metagenome TaxID=1076179 RepID=A0A645BQM3_9ZZZZ
MPPCGGAPNLNASSRKPNFSWASSSPMPITAKTRSWMSRRWIRIEPPPISLPLQTQSYAYASADPGSVSKVSIDSGLGEVKAWCTAVQAPSPTATSPAATASLAGSNSGASTTHRKLQASSSIIPVRRPISSRAAPSSSWEDLRPPAAKKIASPGRAPVAAASPSRSASVMFLATGPASVPSAATVTYARPLAPRCLAHSCQASNWRRGWEAPPGITTAPT